MPYCPNCRYEYLPEMTKCPDCRVDLVEELSAEAKSDKSINLISIFNGPSMTARYLQDILKDRGIASVLPGVQTYYTTPFDGTELNANIEVLVSDQDIKTHRTEIEECLALIGETSN